MPPIKETLPLAAAQAFSIDDSATTEIDDALSVQGLGSGTVVFGIHIAAPGLAIAPDSALDKVARERLSTVYMPGWKLTMLPDAVVQAYTLTAGRDCPAVSLYVTFDEATLAVKASETKLERVPIVANLRHDQLDSVITEASLSGEAPADYAHAAELAFAFRLARHLKAQREVVRGKPEIFNRPDYNFRLEGNERPSRRATSACRSARAQRGAPLDLIVAEAMILANSTWGGWLAECGVPGIYRSQASLAPGVKVRMGIKPGAACRHGRGAVHLGHLAAAPLRRPGQPVADHRLRAARPHRGAGRAVQAQGRGAVLDHLRLRRGLRAPTTTSRTASSASGRCAGWSRTASTELDATVMKDGLVRADTLPLVFRALGTESLPRGARVRVRADRQRPADAGAACHAAGAHRGAGRARGRAGRARGRGRKPRRRRAAPGHRPGRTGYGRGRRAAGGRGLNCGTRDGIARPDHPALGAAGVAGRCTPRC